MSKKRPVPLHIRSRILYHIAKSAWEGQLLARREAICDEVHQEFAAYVSRRYIANQIRIAMGLAPHDADDVISPYDEEALMGLPDDEIIVVNPAACSQCDPGQSPCAQVCPNGALRRGADGHVQLDASQCLVEGDCISACPWGALTEKPQFLPLIALLQNQTAPVYASLAPAFAGQFGPEVTPGRLRSALRRLGFAEVVETALYADLITLKEAFEYDEHVQQASDLMITSCCCPVWIKLIENKFPHLRDRISPSVSPMIASGRLIKAFQPTAKVVFIGPCMAKKSEAQLPDLQGAVDFVLTFQELQAMFEAVSIQPAAEEDAENSQASWSGRIYAHTGGVSTAVRCTLEKLLPQKALDFRPLQVDGLPDCQQVLADITAGKVPFNFIEGMACKGGCVGGPGRLLPPAEGRRLAQEYGATATVQTPAENPNVYNILTALESAADRENLTGTHRVGRLLGRKL